MLPYLSPEQKFSLLYNWPLYGIGLVWLFLRWRTPASLNRWRVFMDGLVVAMAASRFLGPLIPPSGHALFLSYAGLTTGHRLFRVVAVLLLLATIALKLNWGDYHSWLYGILLGAALSVIYRRAGGESELAKSRSLR